MDVKLGMWHRVHQYYQDCLNDDLDLFNSKVTYEGMLIHCISWTFLNILAYKMVIRFVLMNT